MRRNEIARMKKRKKKGERNTTKIGAVTSESTQKMQETRCKHARDESKKKWT